MARSRLAQTLTALLLSTGSLGLTPAAQASDPINTPGGKGAQVYCFMRNSGNSHKVSWIAAYALIKRQSSSPFKTSPEHAAVMITEVVVQNPGSFPDCGKYLGDLYTSEAQQEKQKSAAKSDESTAQDTGLQQTDRYAN